MQRWRILAVALLFAAGLSACGTATEDDPLMVPSEPETARVAQVVTTEAETEETTTEAETTAEETTTAAETEEFPEDVPLNEDGTPVFISQEQMNAKLMKKVFRLLEAAAAHDEEAYFAEFDVETYLRASEGITDAEALASGAAEERERQSRYFQELSEAFNRSFSGSLTDIAFGKWEDGIPGTEIYGLSFYTDIEGARLMINSTAYLRDDEWSVELELWSVIDDAYYDYEPLIVEEMLAAAQGDKDKYLELVDMDMYVDVLIALLLDGDPYPDEDYKSARAELRDGIEDTCASSFEDLSDVLGADFNGKIYQVQYFSKAEKAVLPDGELYGRILLTVLNKDNDYQEVEGYAYSIGGKKGVWLQPD